MVLATLFNLCVDATQDCTAAGSVADLNDLPLELRRKIFLKFGLYSDMTNDGDNHYLPQCLRRPGFFRDFEHLGALQIQSCQRYDRLLATFVSEIERPGSNLAATLISLELRICVDRWTPWYSINRLLETLGKSSHKAGVCRLLAGCRNLQLLHLERCAFCKSNNDPETSDSYNYVLDEIMGALKVGGDEGRAPLKSLTLHDFYDCDIGARLPALQSLQALHLSACSFSTESFLYLIDPCRNTLQTLTLELTCVQDSEDLRLNFGLWFASLRAGARLSTTTTTAAADSRNRSDSIAGHLPVLNCLLTDRAHWWIHRYEMLPAAKRRCLLPDETLRQVRHGRVYLCDTGESDVLQKFADRLSPEIEVIFRCAHMKLERLSLAQELFGRRIVELHIGIGHGPFPQPELYNRVFGYLQSIRVLLMYSDYEHAEQPNGDMFLQSFFSKRDRCEKLRRLRIEWNLSTETLALLFERCVNLERLCISQDPAQWETLPTITDEHLLVWAGNGAKPREVYFGYKTDISVLGVEQLLHNCDGQLRASFLDKRGRLIPNNPNVPPYRF